jgi:hypothetical protein
LEDDVVAADDDVATLADAVALGEHVALCVEQRDVDPAVLDGDLFSRGGGR